MSSQRLVRVNALMQQEIAGQIHRVINDPDFDHAAVTVTHVITSSDLRQARVLVSVRGTPEKQEAMLGLLAHYRKEFQQLVGRHVVMKYTPQLSFELDHSIEKGDNVLQIISRMESEHPEWQEKPDEP